MQQQALAQNNKLRFVFFNKSVHTCPITGVVFDMILLSSGYCETSIICMSFFMPLETSCNNMSSYVFASIVLSMQFRTAIYSKEFCLEKNSLNVIKISCLTK